MKNNNMEFNQKVLDLVNSLFPEVVVLNNHESNSIDIFIDCLNDNEYEITLDVRSFGVRIGRLHKEPSIDYMANFELTLNNLEDIENFLLSCKNTGEFDTDILKK